MIVTVKATTWNQKMTSLLGMLMIVGVVPATRPPNVPFMPAAGFSCNKQNSDLNIALWVFG